MSEIEVKETRLDNCPACNFPTRLGKVCFGEVTNLPYECDQTPYIAAAFNMIGTVDYFTFTCARCGYKWFENNEGKDDEKT